jgi:hypothetical protein
VRSRRSRRHDAPDAQEEPAPASPVPMPAPVEEPPPPLARALRAVSAIGPPVTIAAALLLYFGWARTNAQAAALGLDVSLFGYTPQDYMLRSINSLFFPLIVILVVAILWNALDHALRRRIDAGQGVRAIRAAAVLAVAVGAVGGAVLFAAELFDAGGMLLRPYLIAVGVLVTAWGVRLLRYTERGSRPRLSTEQRAVEATLVLSLVTLLLFWGTADFAGALGRRLAADYELSVGELPRAILYSATPLAISARGVTETAVGSDEDPVYRYDGLRLLVVSGGRFFFLHDGWTRADGLVTVLPDDQSIRFEFGN